MKLPLIIIGALPRPIWDRISKRHIQRLRDEANEAARKEWVTERQAEMLRAGGFLDEDGKWHSFFPGEE